jgi:hypothetical protein
LDVALLSVFEKTIMRKIKEHFYDVVPLKFKTYCVLGSQICIQTLKHFDLHATLFPCQLRHYSDKGIYTVGFFEGKIPNNQWNGHVICKSKNWFLDPSLSTLNKNFQIEVPLIVKVRADDFEDLEFANLKLSDHSVLKWFQAPEHFELKIPEEPQEIIREYTKNLIKMIQDDLVNR